MFCFLEVVAPLYVTLALPYPLNRLVGLRPRANMAQLNVWYIPSVILGAQGHQLPCVTFLAPNKGLEGLALG